jgi:hypothetical protein
MSGGDSEPPSKKKRGPNKKIPDDIKETRATRLRILAEKVIQDKAAKGKLPKGYFNNDLLAEQRAKELNAMLLVTVEDIRNEVKRMEKAPTKRDELLTRFRQIKARITASAPTRTLVLQPHAIRSSNQTANQKKRRSNQTESRKKRSNQTANRYQMQRSPPPKMMNLVRRIQTMKTKLKTPLSNSIIST